MGTGIILYPKRKERGLSQASGSSLDPVIEQITNTTIISASDGTTVTKGVVRLATSAETATGTSESLAVTPYGFAQNLPASSLSATFADQTASRVFDSVIYQNSTKVRLVAVCYYTSTGTAFLSGIQANVGATSPPGSIVGISAQARNATFVVYGTLTFLVLPSYYYRITSAGSSSLQSWIEWDLT